MLTRAYDAIVAAMQVPMMTANANLDFNTTEIDDGVLNCKDCLGTVRMPMSLCYFTGSGLGAISASSNATFPFSYFHIGYNNNYIIPDEDSSEPTYEDYSCPNGLPNGWSLASSKYGFKKEYDETTKEFVCSVNVMWQNISGSAKTVHGIKVALRYAIRSSYNTTNTTAGSSIFLLCREHFTAPVVVENNAIISLSFTWRVGRAGLVAATAASAST